LDCEKCPIAALLMEWRFRVLKEISSESRIATAGKWKPYKLLFRKAEASEK